MNHSFVRLVSSGVAFQAHVSQDSHYVLLPVLEQATRVKGWVVYDTLTGEVVVPEEPGFGDNDGIYPAIGLARQWVTTLYPKQRETA